LYETVFVTAVSRGIESVTVNILWVRGR
jgi:hypothetical protein